MGRKSILGVINQLSSVSDCSFRPPKCFSPGYAPLPGCPGALIPHPIGKALSACTALIRSLSPCHGKPGSGEDELLPRS